jgi:hypothetical protein
MSPSTALFGFVYLLTLVLAPLIALLVQDQVNRWREARERKIWIFRTLMATRATRLDPRHVEALNAIQLEFAGGRSEKKVRDKWKEYLDHLTTPQEQAASPQAWVERGQDYFVDLLYEMAQCLRYNFDKVELKKQCYFPVAHGNIELDQLAIRKGLVELLGGKKPLQMDVVGFPVDENALAAQKHLTALSTEWFEGKRAVVVEAVRPGQKDQSVGGD